MSGYKNIIFVEVEGSENEIPGLEIDAFPTVIIYPS